MDKDFMQYVYARIEKTLTENPKYKDLQGKVADMSRNIMIENHEYEDLTCQIACMEQELCYMRGFNDAMQLIINSKGVD